MSDVYCTRGPFGISNSGSSPISSCLRGLEPKYMEVWSRGNWTAGCVRKTQLQCEITNSSNEQGKLDGFFTLTTVKVPDFADWSAALEDECREQCLRNCSCLAYSYYERISCMSWRVNLIDLQIFTRGRAYLYIQLVQSELGKSVLVFFTCRFVCLSTYAEWNNPTLKLIKHSVAVCIQSNLTC